MEMRSEVTYFEAESEFGMRFRIRDMLNQMSSLDYKEIDSYRAITKLRDYKYLFAINPRT